MKKLLFILYFILPFMGNDVLAHDLEMANADGKIIYYNLTNYGQELSVTYRGATFSSYKNEYYGDIVIPDEVIHNNIVRKVTSIGDSAFIYCEKVTSITIPNSVASIGTSSFCWCKQLTSISIPNSVASIGNRAFDWCEKLASITIPNSVTSIGSEAFSGCIALTSITIPNSITSLEGGVFMDCRSLTSAILPNSLTSIGGNAFYNCDILSSINIPKCLTSIGTNAFYNCSGLTSIIIPQSVKSIEDNAFGACDGLISVKVESGNTKYDSRNNCNAIIETETNTLICGCQSTIIPNSVTSIGEGAFDCSNLTSISIPNSVTRIGDFAFIHCKYLTSVTIPNSVTFIGAFAFYECNKLMEVISKIENPLPGDHVGSVGASTFSNNTFYNGTLYVPSGTIDKYKENWNLFINISDVAIYKLTYIIDNDEYKAYDVPEGKVIPPESEPSKEGYSFSGWSEIPEIMPAHDVTVTGTFSINKYKLTYMVDGEEYKTYEVEYGATITPEVAPADKEGYTFSGWSEIPETMPAHDVTVTGTFSINKYKLTYKVDGVEYKTYDVEYGATITPEAEPTKEGYTFSGWSEIPKTMPAHDVTVTGTFTLDTGINQIMSDENGNAMIFTIDGRRVEKLQKNLNIIRMKDGTTHKVMKK